MALPRAHRERRTGNLRGSHAWRAARPAHRALATADDLRAIQHSHRLVGGLSLGDGGTYHPFKYVCGVISAALKSGVELYTRVRVKRIRSMSPDRHYVTTDRGRIVARRVIVATNAFTRELLPEMRNISPRQSQIMLTEHALDRARGTHHHHRARPSLFQSAARRCTQRTCPAVVWVVVLLTDEESRVTPQIARNSQSAAAAARSILSRVVRTAADF